MDHVLELILESEYCVASVGVYIYIKAYALEIKKDVALV